MARLVAFLWPGRLVDNLGVPLVAGAAVVAGELGAGGGGGVVLVVVVLVVVVLVVVVGVVDKAVVEVAGELVLALLLPAASSLSRLIS